MKEFLLLTGFFLSLKSFACDCGYGGPFLKMAPHTKLVGLVRVNKFLTFKNVEGYRMPMSMEVQVIEIYKGIENRKTFIVWGDPGNLCRPYLDVFREKKYYVMALKPGEPNPGNDNEKETDYSISGCGAFWLAVNIKSDTATGDINSKKMKSSTMALSALKISLTKTAAN